MAEPQDEPDGGAETAEPMPPKKAPARKQPAKAAGKAPARKAAAKKAPAKKAAAQPTTPAPAASVNGEAAREAARLVGVPPFKVAEVSRTARSFSVPRLRRLLSRVAQTDARLKSSRLDDSVWMESLIFDLCRGR